MTADPYAYAEITQVEVGIVRHFLKGTEGMSEDKLVDELFELKQYISSLGSLEVERIIEKCNEDEKHDEIISHLKNAELENRKKSKQGFFRWIFKKSEREDKTALDLSDPEKRKKKISPKSSREHDNEERIIPPLTQPESPQSAYHVDNKEYSPEMSGNTSSSQSTSPRVAPFVFQTRLQSHEEDELSHQYNFQNTASSSALINSVEFNPQNDSEFQEIFRKFVNKFSDN
ncbi:unnamed protein product [Phytomonas sp. EM1]|nr:unnamed protein product [Phytomonas sp. EM1]|eukprot:CCW61721.1 unnamed protein product [Phytomonas sp. isolate EM1]